MGILCMLVKVLTGLQIAGCELQKMPGSAYDSAPQNREGGLELDICRGGPEFLVTLLCASSSSSFICPITQQYAHRHQYNLNEQDSKVRQLR